MSCQNYSELFINTFIQTLAQLSAVIVSGSLGVPLYNYYTRGPSVNQDTVQDTVHQDAIKDSDSDSDIDSDSDSSSSSTFTDDAFSHHQEFRMEEPDVVNH